MATADRAGENSTISSEAFGLLDCFVAGLDDVIYDIAEQVARRRSNVAPDAPVEISVGDVESAAKVVVDALRAHLKEHGDERAFSREIETVQRCLETKARSLRP